MSNKPPIIEHDETEFADKSADWPATFAILGIIIAGNLYFWPFDWRSGLIGFLSGLMLTAWAMDMTGGKIPKSWRRKPRRP